MKNFVQDDDAVTLSAPAGGVGSGDGVLIGNLFGVASSTVSEGGAVNVVMEGVFDLVKLGTDTINQGQRVFWDAGNKRVTETASGNYPIGAATEAAGNGVAVVRVRLDGVATAAAS